MIRAKIKQRLFCVKISKITSILFPFFTIKALYWLLIISLVG